MTSSSQGWDPRDYARNSSAQAGWADELIARLGLRGHEAVLDIGCGDGSVSARLAHSVPAGSVLGVDLSTEMVAAACENFPRTDHPNLQFRRMDATCLDLPRVFDVAFSSAVLHWVADHRAVLRGVAACLRPGGRLLFQMGGSGNAEAILAAAGAVTREPPWEARFEGFVAPYHFYSADDYRGWLAETGFTVIRAGSIPKDMRHESVEGLIGWLRTTWFPFTDRLPPHQREDFLSRVAGAYLADHPPDADGGTHVAMVRLEVEARLD